MLESYQDDLAGLNTTLSIFFAGVSFSVDYSPLLSGVLSARASITQLANGAGAMLTNKIGKQLLIDHVQGPAEYDALMNTLETLGYPSLTTNIAITNGSVLGVEQPMPMLNTNGAYYEFFGKKGENVESAYFGAHFALYPTVAGEQNLYSKFSGWVQKQAPCAWPLNFMTCTSTNETSITPKTRTTSTAAKELDRVPGSRATLPPWELEVNNKTVNLDGTPGQVLEKITDEFFVEASDVVALKHVKEDYTFTFVPTYSALDIDMPDPSESMVLYLSLLAQNGVSVVGSMLDGVSEIEDFSFDAVYVNGDNALAEHGEDDNADHLTVYWPSGVVDAIKDAVAPTFNNTEKLLLWFNTFPVRSFSDIDGLLRAALGLNAIENFPREFRYLSADLYNILLSKKASNVVILLDDLFYDHVYDEPTAMTVALLAAMENVMEGEELTLELSKQDCLNFGYPTTLCDKAEL